MSLFITASSSNLMAISLAADGIFALFAPQTRAKLYNNTDGAAAAPTTSNNTDLITYINQCQGIVQTGYAASAASLLFGLTSSTSTAVGVNFVLNSLFNLRTLMFSNLPKQLGLDVKGEYLNLITNTASSAALLLPVMTGSGSSDLVLSLNAVWWSIIGLSLCFRPATLRSAGFRSKDWTSECEDAAKGLGRTMISAAIFFGFLTMEGIDKNEAFGYSMMPLLLNGFMKN